MIPLALFLFFSGLLWLFGVFGFHINFRIFYSISMTKNVIMILIVIALNLWIALGNMDISTVLILLIHEYGISFSFFVLSSISFISVLHQPFTSLVKFIPRYFILSLVIINGIAFLVSLYTSSLLVYRNNNDACVLILYPATLLCLSVISNIFCWSP